MNYIIGKWKFRNSILRQYIYYTVYSILYSILYYANNRILGSETRDISRLCAPTFTMLDMCLFGGDPMPVYNAIGHCTKLKSLCIETVGAGEFDAGPNVESEL